jgi:hypothetical protein
LNLCLLNGPRAGRSKEFELCSPICQKILDKYPADPTAQDFSESERTIVTVWTVSGIVENGGFEYLFESTQPGDPTYELVLKAFRDIECSQALEAVQEAFALFPSGQPLMNDSSRVRKYRQHPQALREAINTKFWTAIPDIDKCLARYILTHGLT